MGGFAVIAAGNVVWGISTHNALIRVGAQLVLAPTPEGARFLDEIEGFRIYLGATEGDSPAPGDLTGVPEELKEWHLAYAIALDVEPE